MKIGLIDADRESGRFKKASFPNLALMKISSYEKSLGNNVEWASPIMPYDKVYISKVFTDTPDIETIINANEIIRGGSGFDLKNKLPNKVEKQFPDYALYGVKEAYGFLTRGCPRACDFCIVADKEGRNSYKVADLNEFWNGQKEIKLLDPNLLGSKEKYDLLYQLKDSGAWIDFTQGLDVRLMNDETVNFLRSMKVKAFHFAWDNYEFDTFELLKKYATKVTDSSNRPKVYVLTNFNTNLEQDYERIMKLREIDLFPYVMIYEKWKLPRNHFLKRLQRWTTKVNLWKKYKTYEEYEANTYKSRAVYD